MSLLEFFYHIENNLYNSHMIYRSIIILRNDIECFRLKQLLQNNDHCVHILENIHSEYDLNNIDCRIIIIKFSQFEELVQHLYCKDNIKKLSYNFIAFSFTIDNMNVKNALNFFLNHTKNNIYNTIIFDYDYKTNLNLRSNI